MLVGRNDRPASVPAMMGPKRYSSPSNIRLDRCQSPRLTKPNTRSAAIEGSGTLLVRKTAVVPPTKRTPKTSRPPLRLRSTGRWSRCSCRRGRGDTDTTLGQASVGRGPHHAHDHVAANSHVRSTSRPLGHQGRRHQCRVLYNADSRGVGEVVDIRIDLRPRLPLDLVRSRQPRLARQAGQYLRRRLAASEERAFNRWRCDALGSFDGERDQGGGVD